MAADQEPSTSTSAPDTEMELSSTPAEREENLKTALNALVQGKRHLLVKDIPLAISSLGEACRLITEVYGPVAPENAEAHFYYGKALLEQSRLDLAVFEGPECAKAESEAEESSEEAEGEEGSEDDDNEAEAEANGDEKGETDAKDAEVKNGESESAETEPKVMDTDEKEAGESKVTENGVESTEGIVATAEEDLNIPSPSEKKEKSALAMEISEEQPSTSSGPVIEQETVEADAEEELGNLQLAWEVLEVAKVAYGKQLEGLIDNKTEVADADSKSHKMTDLQKKLADTHLLLGEVATESEMYVEAVGEFKTGLLLLTKIEEPDSREIAQYYFQIGLAYAFAKSFADAIASFKMSMEIIERRINNLIEKRPTPFPEVKEEDAEKSAEDKEIYELKALLPELQEKINDTIDAENDSKKTQEEETKEQEIIMRNSPVKNPNPPVANDISHLVKKRKKPEETAEVEPPTKRVCNLFPQAEQDNVSSSTLTPTKANGNSDVPA